MKEMKHTDRLLNEVRTLIKENNIQDGELYIGHFLRFFAQCKHDEIFRLAKVEWDAENKDFDIWWDTKLQDSVCSICPLWFNFRIWIGEDSHKKNAECYFWGMGGRDYEDNEDDFAFEFFEFMEENIEYIKEDEPYLGNR